MLGVYVHIPYCKAVCPYCDFNVYVAKGAAWERLLQGIQAELAARAVAFAEHTQVRSLYFGGGTPSLASAAFLATVRDAVTARFPLLPEAEITVEVDPGTLDSAGFAALRALGVTRLSLGWQSTHDHLLRVLGRGHSAADSHAAFLHARAAGFDNLSFDLIFGVPGQTLADLDGDLDAILRLGPEHVSLYNLTYHEGTPYARWRESGRLPPVAEDLEVAMMARIEERLGSGGYEHYEVSNYARPGARAVHNAAYWSGADYLGLGPGAHSFKRQGFERGWRWESTREPGAYFAAWVEAARLGIPKSGDSTVTFCEELGAAELVREFFLLGLRRSDGIDLGMLPQSVDTQAVTQAVSVAVTRGWAVQREQHLAPTALGLRHADALAELFF